MLNNNSTNNSNSKEMGGSVLPGYGFAHAIISPVQFEATLKGCV